MLLSLYVYSILKQDILQCLNVDETWGHGALWNKPIQFSPVWLFVIPWTAARQAFLSITNSRSLLKLMSIESLRPSNHLILCHPLLLLPSIFPSIRVLTNETVVRISWPKYRSFSFSISPSNGYPITQRQILYDSTYTRYLKESNLGIFWQFSG